MTYDAYMDEDGNLHANWQTGRITPYLEKSRLGSKKAAEILLLRKEISVSNLSEASKGRAIASLTPVSCMPFDLERDVRLLQKKYDKKITVDSSLGERIKTISAYHNEVAQHANREKEFWLDVRRQYSELRQYE